MTFPLRARVSTVVVLALLGSCTTSPAPLAGDNCPAGTTACGGACTDVSQDAAHCGACGVTCPASMACRQGACLCPSGLTSCAGTCVDLQSSGQSCGACGNDCTASGLVCSLGACAEGCADGLTLCGTSCVDVASSVLSCGQCGVACAPEQGCSAGVCGCGAGLGDCAGACRDFATDPLNCGACGSSCAAGASCQSGQCVATATGSGGTGGAGSAGPAPGIMFSPPSGSFRGTVAVTISAADGGAEIRYTVDGSVPTASSPLYSGTPIVLDASARVVAQAFATGSPVGEPVVAVYVEHALEGTVDLPILVLDSYGAGVPEPETTSPWGMPTTEDRAYLDAALLVYADAGAALSGTPTLATRAAFRLRGQSSAMFPKPPYRLELRDARGEDTQLPLLGMPADGDWVLRNPYADKALIRDAFFYGLGREMGLHAPRYAFCELYRNGDPAPADADDYLGVYLLLERIENSKDRLDLEQLKEEDRALPEITGGYIFKFEWEASEEPLVECSGASHCWSDLEVVDPNPLVPEQEAWLGQHLRSFVDVLFGAGFGDPSTGYAGYIDVRSFVDHVILNELGRSMDAYVRSQHFYKDRDTKIFAGPLWDFDLVFGVGGFFENQSVEGWQHEQVSARSGGNDWFPRLLEDPGFQAALAGRWQELRPGLLSDAQLDARVDALVAPLAAAAARNFARWPILADASVPPFQTSTAATWEGQVAALRDWMHRRVAWLDTQWR